MDYAQLLLPDFSLILCGYLICRYTALNRSVWQPVESLVYYLLFPVLLFQSIVKSPVDIGAASGLIAAGLGMGLTGIALAYSLPHWPWLGPRIDAREGARQRIRGQRRRRQLVEQQAAERVEGARPLATGAAEFEVAGEDQPRARLQAAGGQRQQQLVFGVVSDVHRQRSSRRRSWATARRTRDLTVPSGIASSSAMRECGSSS